MRPPPGSDTAGALLRVLVVCYEFPPVGGGGGRVAASIAAGLARKGHQVRVLTSRAPGLAAEGSLDGCSVRRVFAGRRRLDRCTIPEMAAYVAAQALPALAEVRRFAPDVVHVHFAVPSGPVAWFAARPSGVPYVLTIHLGDVPGGVPEQTERLFRIVKPFTIPVWRGAAAVTAVASHVAELARLAYGIQPEIILNGIDMTNRTTRPRRADALRAVWCGRMQRQKNLAAGIRGLAAARRLPWTLDVIGDGPLRPEVEAAVREAGLVHHVRLHGWLPADAVAHAFAEANLLFLPSASEGLSIVTVEALRAGLAFVASRIPGINDVVDEANGILCDPARPAGFGEAFAWLAAAPATLENLQAASIARAPAFHAARMIDAYEQVLRTAAGTQQ